MASTKRAAGHLGRANASSLRAGAGSEEPGTRDSEDALDRVFQALANRTRRAQLKLLANGPAMVTELAEPFDMSLPAASKHLRVLERAGLVNRDIDGRVHRCSLNAEPLANIRQWVEHYRVFWDQTLESLARFVEEPEADGDPRT